MKIAIIGAGLAGLAAGRELALAGHEVTVLEKNRDLGGRLASGRRENGTIFDIGLPWLSATTPAFRGFAAELLENEIVRVWEGEVLPYDGEKLLDENPDGQQTLLTAPGGVNGIARYLSRWVDLLPGEKAGGLTYIGDNRSRKRPWMVNLTSFRTLEADAVIVATPAPEAYGVLLTTQDEVNVLKLIREMDEIHYDASWVLAAGYGDMEPPERGAIRCQNSPLRLLVNEQSKRENPETVVVMHSGAGIARSGEAADRESVTGKLLREAARVAGDRFLSPDWTELHYWRFSRPRRFLDRPYLEFESNEAPLAVIGDYFGGSEIEHAYVSGIRLARAWMEKRGVNVSA